MIGSPSDYGFELLEILFVEARPQVVETAVLPHFVANFGFVGLLRKLRGYTELCLCHRDKDQAEKKERANQS